MSLKSNLHSNSESEFESKIWIGSLSVKFSLNVYFALISKLGIRIWNTNVESKSRVSILDQNPQPDPEIEFEI